MKTNSPLKHLYFFHKKPFKTKIIKQRTKKLNQLNQLFKKYITYDNETEMARYEIITQKTGMKIYLAHSYFS